MQVKEKEKYKEAHVNYTYLGEHFLMYLKVEITMLYTWNYSNIMSTTI